MSKSTGRSIELATNRFLARDRMPIFLGSEQPQTIAMKEIIDNEIDIVSDHTQPATKAIIYMSPSRLKVMDNGLGITADDVVGDSGRSSLFHACATMFSSSNYNENSKDTIGANGVGMTLANYTSAKFSILNFNGPSAKGYSFTDGYLNGPESVENTEENPDEIKALPSGDYAKNPLTYDEANEMFDPFFEHGFLIDVTWHPVPNTLFIDKANIDWLIHYAEVRCGEITGGEIEIHTFEDHEFTKPKKVYIWNKDENSEHYVPSWLEKCKTANAEIIKDGNWTFAFGIDENMKIDSICQGALVRVPYDRNLSIQIQDYSIQLSVPFSLKYNSSEYPPYTDQTKVTVRLPYVAINRAFEKSGEVYKHFYRQAEKAYMTKVIKDSDSSMFWPSLGPSEESELIIAEGYSPISALKAQRDPYTQACIALRGKISNTWNLDMVKAMRSDIVKQMLNAVLYNNYKRIIIAVDADDDGNHIASLLIALFYRFTDVIQQGKLYYVHTPHYIFKKRGKEIMWSDQAKDCPAGYHVTTLKGLGGMEAHEVELFIMNHETRDLIQIKDDQDAWESLDEAFSYGGEHWILTN